MRKQLLLLALLTLVTFVQGTAQITLSNDTIICPPDSAYLTATITGSVNTNNYVVSNIPYAPESNLGTNIFLTDDSFQGPLPIGFSFSYFCQNYTQFYVCSNGWISFTQPFGGWQNLYNSVPIPSTVNNVPKNAIMGPWQDWNPSSGGTVRYQTIGTAPNRKLVVSYIGMAFFSCGLNGGGGTFQIVLHEGSNIIENHITNKPTGGTSSTTWCGWGQGNAVQGLHNATGTVAVINSGRNDTQWTAFNESTRYTPSSITWTNLGNNTTAGTGLGISVSPSTTTSYEASTTLCNGTVVSDTVTVIVNCSFAVMDSVDVVCNGDSSGMVIAEDTAFAATGPWIFTWEDGSNNTILINSKTVPIDTLKDMPAGNYTVFIDGGNGALSVGFSSINEPDSVFNLTGSIDVLCNGDSTGIIFVEDTVGISNINNSNGLWEYIWTDSNGDTIRTTSNSTSNMDTVPNLAIGTYNVFIDGCLLSSGSVTLSEPAVLGGIIDNVQSIKCPGGISDGSGEVFATGGVPPYSYLWSSGATAKIANNLSVGLNFVTVTDINGCTIVMQTNVTEPAPIVATVGGGTTICISNTTPIWASSIGGTAPYYYSWSNGAMGDTAYVSPSQTRIYTVTTTDTNGCPGDTLDVEIIVREPLVVTEIDVSPDTICLGDDAFLFAQGGGGDSTYSYAWSNGAGFGPSPTVSPGASTWYHVTVTDFCGTNPPAIDSVWLQVGGYRDITTVTTGNDTICIGDSVTFSTYASGGIGGPFSYTFQWNNDLGFGPRKTVKPVKTTTYTLTVTDQCLTEPGIANVTIYVGDYPLSGFNASVIEGCVPVTTQFTMDAKVEPGYTYLWSFDNENFFGHDERKLETTFEAPGCHDITLHVTSDLNCFSSYTRDCYIETFANPTAQFDFGPKPTSLNRTVQFKNTSLGASSILWNFDDGLVTEEEWFSHTFEDTYEDKPSIYQVTLFVENEDGCVDQVTVPITVEFESTFYVPNAFTPDGDGLNDLFGPVGEISVDNYQMFIYDRWGNQIFESRSLAEMWNGRVNNTSNKVPIGVYAYVIRYRDFEGILKEVLGSVTVAGPDDKK